MNKIKNKIFFIIGPTASGKTFSSIELAKKINGEILNSDAFSFYKNCDIMTAKATIEEQKKVKHHMISFLSINDYNYNVRNFKQDAKLQIQQLLDQQKPVIIVGGSNYFQQSLIFGNKQQKKFQVKDDIKKKIEQYLQQEDFDKAYDELQKTNIQLYFHKNDYRKTLNLSKQILDDVDCDEYINLDFQSPQFENAKFLILRNTDKNFALDLIKKRIQEMLFENDGLQEIWNTLQYYDQKQGSYQGVFQGIGYKEFLEVYQKYPDLKNNKQDILQSIELKNCIDLLELRTFQLYKSQLKWIKKYLLKYPVVSTNCVILDFDREIYEAKGKKIFIDSINELLNLKVDEILTKDVEKNDNKLYNCEECNKVMNGMTTYQLHINSQKHKKIIKLKNSVSKKVYNILQNYHCNICNKKLIGDNHYKQHMNSKKHLKMLKEENQFIFIFYFCN